MEGQVPEAQPMSIETMMQNRVARYNASKGNLNLTDGYNCPECLNRGYFMELRNDVYERLTECKCMKTRANILRMKDSGLENVIKRMTFDAYEVTTEWQRVAKETAQRYANESIPREWFFIGGAVGSGKTHLCTAICRELLYKGESVKYVMWSEESTALKGLTGEENDELGRRMHTLQTVDVLYIDDFFKPSGLESKPTKADMRLAYQIINARYVNNKRTIISSEWQLEMLMEFDEATASRIYERSKDHYIGIDNEKHMARNYRMRGYNATASAE